MEVSGVKIEFLGHDGFLFSNGHGKKYAIDPYNVPEQMEKADYILITHSHYDHCSIKDIEKLVKPGTVIVMPADVQSKITRIEGVQMEVVEVGDEISLGHVKVEAFPAYNIGKPFHAKGDGVGYLIKFEKVIIYHSGDSDKIPEMQKLTGYGKEGNQFIALLPVSGTYVMSAEEASEVALMLKPDLVIPMHYGSGVVGTLEDAERFVKICNENKVRAEIIDKILI